MQECTTEPTRISPCPELRPVAPPRLWGDAGRGSNAPKLRLLAHIGARRLQHAAEVVEPGGGMADYVIVKV